MTSSWSSCWLHTNAAWWQQKVHLCNTCISNKCSFLLLREQSGNFLIRLFQDEVSHCCPSSHRLHLLLLAALKQHRAVLTVKTTQQDCERQFGLFFPSVSCLVAVNKIVFSVWQWLIQRAVILGADGASG